MNIDQREMRQVAEAGRRVPESKGGEHEQSGFIQVSSLGHGGASLNGPHRH